LTSVDIIYSKPKWIPIIYDKDQVVQGKILLSYCLIEKAKAKLVDHVSNIKPKMAKVELAMFCLGYVRLTQRPQHQENLRRWKLPVVLQG